MNTPSPILPATLDIPKAYDSREWEDSLYKKWEESGYFHPEKMLEDKLIASDAPVFSMVLPPPNVTGNLHVGHAS
ncbi:MAG: class I tRNA ligase family protein, partial [Candidatus Moraniibacteriota bacterium]